MIRQTVLPFKLETTRDLVTPHAGLALLGEFALGLGLQKALDRHLPAPGSGAGYRPSEHVYPLLLMLNGGGRSLEDTRQIRDDEALRKVLGLERMPSSDATGDWLRRTGNNGGLQGLGRVCRRVLKRALNRDGRIGYTLDIDATAIEAEKESAQWTYKKFKGYMPMLGHLVDNGLVVGDEFREGNDSPGARNLDFIKCCQRQMPKGKRIKFVRSDSAAYQSKVFNHCEREGIGFAIGADMDSAVKDNIKTISDKDWRRYRDGHIAETVHSMEKTKKAFRLIVLRRPYQRELFEGTEPGENYTVIATNLEGPAEDVLRWYNRRGECSENRIKELKLGFGMERGCPVGSLRPMRCSFALGCWPTMWGVCFAHAWAKLASTSGGDAALAAV